MSTKGVTGRRELSDELVSVWGNWSFLGTEDFLPHNFLTVLFCIIFLWRDLPAGIFVWSLLSLFSSVFSLVDLLSPKPLIWSLVAVLRMSGSSSRLASVAPVYMYSISRAMCDAGTSCKQWTNLSSPLHYLDFLRVKSCTLMMMTRSWHGLIDKILWKNGLQAERTNLCAWIKYFFWILSF